MRFLKKLFVTGLLLMSLGANAQVCGGSFFNPLFDTDWNNMFPITIMGVRMGGLTMNPPLMYEPPICVCPRLGGIPFPGIGVTFWEPLYIAEIETPGCLSTLGGINILSGFKMLQNGANDSADGQGTVNRMQVHWYEYPVFAVLDLFTSLTCLKVPGVALMGVTEILPTWQNDLWSAIFSPESALFSSPLLQAACAVDAMASSLGYTLDFMPWCAGTWGSIYPFSGNAGQANTSWSSNNLTLAKYIAWQHRIGLLWQSIGPTAICFNHPNPFIVKSQYRYNQVLPLALRGLPVVTGGTSLGVVSKLGSVTHLPSKESSAHLIWQGQQCCLF